MSQWTPADWGLFFAGLAALITSAVIPLVVALRANSKADANTSSIDRLSNTADNHDAQLTKLSGDVGEVKGAAAVIAAAAQTPPTGAWAGASTAPPPSDQ